MQHLTTLGVNNLQSNVQKPDNKSNDTSEEPDGVQTSDTSTNQRDEVKREAPRDQQSRHLHKRGVIYKNEHQSMSCVGKPVCIVMSE